MRPACGVGAYAAGSERSAPLDLWGPVLTQAPCRFISLQYGEVGEDVLGVRGGLGVDVHVDGDVNPYVYAWSDEVPIKTWAIGSGCATFYNTSASPNTSVTRFLESDRFEITATRDIQAGEELTHAYANLRLRTCYQGLGESWG